MVLFLRRAIQNNAFFTEKQVKNFKEENKQNDGLRDNVAGLEKRLK